MRNAIFLTLPFAILQAKRDWKMKREPVHLNRNEKYFNVINIWVFNLLASIRRINKIKWRQIELINCKDNSTPELTRSFSQAFFHDAVSLLLTRRNTRSRKGSGLPFDRSTWPLIAWISREVYVFIRDPSDCVWLYRHVSHASRDDSALRAFHRANNGPTPAQGAPRKHAPTDEVMSTYANRFLEAIASQ